MKTKYDDAFDDPAWLSDCCGAISYEDLNNVEIDSAGSEMRVGLCFNCKEHATFHRAEHDDSP